MAKNIYFVEFGNYNISKNEITDKQVYPVKADNLSMATAQEKLAHLMGILHKNVVVSISEMNSSNFEHLYNMETATLCSYDVTFVLITVVERDISTEKFATFEDARKQMVKETLESVQDENLLNEYYEFMESNGNFDGDEFGIGSYSAWANANGENYDWRIIVC